MVLNLNMNAIFTGYIDAVCLVCEYCITSDDDAERHISLQSHKSNLESTQLVERFKDDHILKVKQRYYCMLCNLIFPTLTKVGLHVVENEHTIRRGSNLLQRVGPLIRFGDVIIEEKAWQGLVGDMCSVCNTEFDDETKHLADFMHAMNLVKNKVEFDAGHIYRKIDETTFQCLTCNSVLPLIDIAKHFEDSEHKNLLSKRTNDKFESLQTPSTKEEIKAETKKENLFNSDYSSSSSEGFNSAEGSSPRSSDNESISEIIEIPMDKEYNTSKILESVTVFEKNEVNINFENETAFCKKCLGNVDFEFRSIEHHIEEHKRNPQKRDVGYVAFPCEADMRAPKPKNDTKSNLPTIAAASNGNASGENATALDDNHNVIVNKPEKTEASKTTTNEEPLNESPVDFAKRNNLTYNQGNNNAFCRLCLTRLPSSLRSMQEHVSGNVHRKKVSINQARASAAPQTRSYRKMPMEDYIDEVLTIENVFFGTVKVVNEKFCMGTTSFHLITENEHKLRCQVCELFINRIEMSSHIESCRHERLFRKVPVLWSIRNEFVREVRPGIFHCGFCNLMEASPEGLETHFQSAEHRAKKNAAEDTLAQHKPGIAEYKQRRAIAHFADWLDNALS